MEREKERKIKRKKEKKNKNDLEASVIKVGVNLRNIMTFPFRNIGTKIRIDEKDASK